MVSCKSVSAGYDGRSVIRAIDCDFSPGTFTGIIGPNGAGKTTLLKTLNRLVRPLCGSVSIDGRDLENIPIREIARRIGYMPYHIDLHFDFTVLEVVLFGRYPHLKNFEWESRKDTDEALASLETAGIGGFANRMFHELSSGEKKLVLFAKTLAQKPDIFLLDEPFSGLDIKYAGRLLHICTRLAESGRTVIMSVHELDIASRGCSHLVLLGHGKIAASGAPADVLVPSVLDPVYGVRTIVHSDALSGARFVSAFHSDQ